MLKDASAGGGSTLRGIRSPEEAAVGLCIKEETQDRL